MAGESVARAEAAKLKALIEDYGVRCSIELQQGRGEWYVRKYLVMNHHTAVWKPGMTNLTPALFAVKNGRSSPTVVPGPLANGYGGRDFIFRIITMGLANHPGAGGPITIDGVHVPQDSMRPPSFGIEWEGGYHTWDAKDRDWMARVNKALTQFYGRSIHSQLEHKDWAPDRKVDRNLPMTRAVSISDTAKIAPGGVDMIEADHDRIAATVRAENKRLAQYLALGQGNQAFPASTEPVWFGANAITNPKLLAAIAAVGDVDIDEVALAQTLLPALLTALDPQQVADIIADALGSTLGQNVVDALAAKLAA